MLTTHKMLGSIEGIVKILEKGIINKGAFSPLFRAQEGITYTKIEVDEGHPEKRIVVFPMNLDLLLQGHKVRVMYSELKNGTKKHILKVMEGPYKDSEYNSSYIPPFNPDKVSHSKY